MKNERPCCTRCWDKHWVQMMPVRISKEYRKDEICVWCGEPTGAGIYESNQPTYREPQHA